MPIRRSRSRRCISSRRYIPNSNPANGNISNANISIGNISICVLTKGITSKSMRVRARRVFDTVIDKRPGASFRATIDAHPFPLVAAFDWDALAKSLLTQDHGAGRRNEARGGEGDQLMSQADKLEFH
jgi:hypothetical protein